MVNETAVPLACLVLAAGGSTRLGGGRAKQLLLLEGETLVRRAARAALAANLGGPVVVVLGCRAEECAAQLAGLPVRTARAAAWAAGMGASLKVGLHALTAEAPGLAGVVVTLCDQPLVTAEDLAGFGSALAMMGLRGPAPAVVAAAYGGGLGVPALFTRETFAEIAALDDAAGAKGLLARHADRGRAGRLPLPHAAVDVDTAEDYERLVAGQD